MIQPTYKIEYVPEKDRYVFESIGPQGIITKVVMFSEMDDNIYNFGFGDYDYQTELISYTAVSDNGDIVKVLATVISIAVKFLSENLMSYIYIEGSDSVRTQLYQRIINRYYERLIPTYEIFGLIEGEPEPFQKDKSYESFLIRKLF